ncbi:Tat pathway signal protein [Streptomyces sp. NBC_00637]|uniref:Tat pathway signal protein n=1 Tax=Streptomyces sp. NBC_00637 TaxID=2903667 RepID=UPI0032506FB0
MARRLSFGGTWKKLAVAAASAGLVIGLSGQAQAATYWQSTWDGCASVDGDYSYWKVSNDGGGVYNTSWNFTIWDNCADGKGAGLYTTFSKWDNNTWTPHGYTKLGSDSDGANGTPGYASGNGYSLKDVRLYVCFVGDPGSCRALF